MLYKNKYGVEFTRTDYKKRSVVKVKSENGYLLRAYRMNNLPFYENKYLSWANLDMCNGWQHDETYIIKAINAGTKPCGTINIYTKHNNAKEIADALISLNLNKETHCFVAGANWEMYPGGFNHIYYIIPLRKTLADYFDLNEIREAYQAQGVYFSEKEWDKVMYYANSHLEDLYWNGELDLINPVTDEQIVITGLAFGYPLESTASIILGY